MSAPLVFRVSGRKLVVGLLLTVVPISLAALYAATMAGQATERATGRHLETVSRSVANEVRDRIEAKVIESALMASDAAVQEVVRASNRQYFRVQDDVIRERLLAKDKIWNTPEGVALVEQTMSSPASKSLRRNLTVDPNFLRITVTDREGATVASTHKTLDYYQADEEYWQNIYFYGRGVVSLTDVLYDDATKNYYIGFGVPVVNETNQIIGTLDALVQVSSLFVSLNRTELGLGGRVVLAKKDGSVVVSSDGLTLADNARSSEVDAVVDAQGNFEGRTSGYFDATFPGGREVFVAFAHVGLEEQYAQLDWMIVAVEDLSGSLGSISFVQVVIMGIALLSLACVVFLIVYFTLHRPSEIEEVEEGMGETIKRASA
jgi:hypothetical protein